jgi:hypothetical protein
MKSFTKMINAVRYAGSSILFIGISSFIYGFFVSGSSTLVGISIGTIMGAVFIFLMGMFFVATEEMLDKTFKGIEVNPIKPE